MKLAEHVVELRLKLDFFFSLTLELLTFSQALSYCTVTEVKKKKKSQLQVSKTTKEAKTSWFWWKICRNLSVL